jgi:hypothetical protein
MHAGDQAIMNLIKGLAEHDITLVQFSSAYAFAMIFLMLFRFLLQFSQLGRMPS